MYNDFSHLKSIKKFTTKSDIDILIGNPKFQIENRLVFYYGNGIFIAYSTKCFKIEGTQRTEYGEEGLYAVCFYHFCDTEMLKLHLNMASFSDDNLLEVSNVIIDNEISYGMSFKDIQKIKHSNQFTDSYREGATQVLEDNKMKTQNLFIMYGPYTLFFRGTSKNSKLSGFQYTFYIDLP